VSVYKYDREHNAGKPPRPEPTHKSFASVLTFKPASAKKTGSIRIRVRLKMAYTRITQLK
jgi:hypothetical protein